MTKILTPNGWKPLDEGFLGKKKPKNPEEPWRKTHTIDHEHWVENGKHMCFFVARNTEEGKKSSARKLNRPVPTNHVPPDVEGHQLMEWDKENNKWIRFPPKVAEKHEGTALGGQLKDALRGYSGRWAERTRDPTKNKAT